MIVRNNAQRRRSRAHRLTLRVALAVIGSLALSLAWGMAAGFGLNGAPLSGATAELSFCDGDGFSYRYTSSADGQLTAVQVTSISAACAGGTLRLTLTNGTSSVGSGSAVLPSSGFSGSVDVSISPTPAANVVSAVRVAIEGP